MSKDKDTKGITTDPIKNFGEYYTEIVTKAEMIEYYDISGCYILRPNSFIVWELVKEYLDNHFKSFGVRNVYFPLLVSKRNLEKEEDHIADFSPEVAWVTRSGQSEMQEPVAIRPTSETVMYPTYAKWIRSHRDLPLLLNQWCNVVRWEFKDPTPFIRSREFLWQEGHTAHATLEGASAEVYKVLDFYADCYKDLLAVPVIKGKKSEKEKFAGATFTTTIEGFIPRVGKGVQAATSHCLGQNFSKMFNISYEDEQGSKERKHVYQNSWGFTTRSIGVMIMIHADAQGMVFPPRVAPTQVAILPLFRKKKEENEALAAKANEYAELLRKAGLRVTVDDRDNYNAGWKFNYWDLMGCPLRLNLGPRDLTNKVIEAVRRDLTKNEEGKKASLPEEGLVDSVKALLDTIHENMYSKAKKNFDDHIVVVDKWENVTATLNDKNIIKAAWCNTVACEESIKKRSGQEGKEIGGEQQGAAKSLCMPLEQDKIEEGTCCFACDKRATAWALFGRSF